MGPGTGALGQGQNLDPGLEAWWLQIKGTIVTIAKCAQCHFLSQMEIDTNQFVSLLKKQRHLLMTSGSEKFLYCPQKRMTDQNHASYFSAAYQLSTNYTQSEGLKLA